jgi:signal transduction histidine kinase/CheY-like chemotaxis protein
MTSHELRNPLSAVVQCAESSIATLERLSLLASPTTPTETSPLSFQEEFEGIIDSLQTILTCSAHQKRVVDDVLALSKLDAGLIQITPVRVQICVVVLEAMKMFDVECRQLGIKLEFEEEASCKDFDWVMLDPSRLLQVLINLLYVVVLIVLHILLTYHSTNAIKFTKDCPTKKITVELGGSYMRPPEVWESMPLKTDDQLRTTILDEPGWGNGPKAYLWIKVRDTGCGMSEDEQKRLFSRFSQATPRTHVRYGGSGLGLFISKTLATLQGGAIGASSKKDVGSTFAFFVSTRTTDAPTNQLTGLTSRVRPVLGNRIMTSEDAMRAVKLNVLIVEDNLVNQKVLRKQLQKFGWTVHVAGDGAEALVWLKGSYYWRGEQKNESCVQHGGEVDVILLDMEMPIMDGLTCVRRIREWEEQGLLANPPSISRRKSRGSIPTQSLSPIASNYDSNESEFRIPVLAVSANARMEQIQEALRAGMDDSITKPFRIPELWPKIQGLVPRLSGD